MQLARYSTSSGAAAALPSRAATPTEDEIKELTDEEKPAAGQVHVNAGSWQTDGLTKNEIRDPTAAASANRREKPDAVARQTTDPAGAVTGKSRTRRI